MMTPLQTLIFVIGMRHAIFIFQRVCCLLSHLPCSLHTKQSNELDNTRRSLSTVHVMNKLEKKEPAPQRMAEVKKERKVVRKLYPNSALFRKWGDELSEEEQKEAERLFQSYGYNVFLSDRLPLNREIPDTRPHR